MWKGSRNTIVHLTLSISARIAFSCVGGCLLTAPQAAPRTYILVGHPGRETGDVDEVALHDSNADEMLSAVGILIALVSPPNFLLGLGLLQCFLGHWLELRRAVIEDATACRAKTIGFRTDLVPAEPTYLRSEGEI
jgi:hypothetical protein